LLQSVRSEKDYQIAQIGERLVVLP
jgi:hypothetical protein